MKRIFFFTIGLCAITVLSSCHPDPYVRRGRAGGATVGAIAGGVISDSWGGAAVGAAVGGLIGDQRGKTNSMYYGYGGPRRTGYYYY